MKRFLTILLYLCVFISFLNLNATPEFSLWTGNKCSTCHINAQGGGLRNEFGWAFAKDASFLVAKDISLQNLFDLAGTTTNSHFGGLFSLGTDMRFQYIRSHKTEDAISRIIPMQASIYLSSKISEWLILEGQFNIAKKVFSGQQIWAASLNIKPFQNFPYIRAGFFQPSIGIKDCDMTSLDRRITSPDGTESLIAPDFAEYGAEIVYDNIDLITISAGLFDSKSLSENSLYGEQLSLVNVRGNPSFTSKFILYPTWLFDWIPDSYIGSSVLVNGRFILTSMFMGLSLSEDLHIYGKAVISNIPYIRHTENYIAGVSYIPFKGIILGIRYENGLTDLIFSSDYIYKLYSTQIVISSKIFILPYIEIIPEYRMLECEEYRSTRWALQMHFYY